ncbi:MAG: UDP-N-acetylmuramate dehydrogenase [Candidatus Andersenbacteria bacterium]
MKIEENVNLSRFTSLHVGGPAAYFASAKTVAEVIEAVQFAAAKKVPLFVLGKGSNTVFSSKGFPGLVIQMADRRLEHEGSEITASSGVFMRQLVNFSLDHELQGLEELAGIPGTVGGAIRGNAGTWSTEISDRLKSILVLDTQNPADPQLKTISPTDCFFDYRDSIFKRRPELIILQGTFLLVPGDKAAGEALVRQDLEQRHTKQPYHAPSAGSIFKNPDKANGIFAGQLIEKAGLKGTTIGGAAISEKHGNFIINSNHATSDDVLKLIALIQQTIQEKYNVRLEPEIEIVK